MKTAELELVEDGLVNIYKGDDVNLVDARELHEFLGVGKVFGAWLTGKFSKYGLEDGVDYFPKLESIQGRGRPRKDYLLTMDTAKEIAMVENNDKGREVRKYFIGVEKKYRQQNNLKPTDLNTLKILVDQQIKQQKKADKMEQDMKNISFYLYATPDRKKISNKVTEYARMTGLKTGDVYKAVYQVIEDKFGIDIPRRVDNRRMKINEERVASNKKPYKDTTLCQKVNGMDFVGELDLNSEFLEVLAGLIMKEGLKV